MHVELSKKIIATFTLGSSFSHIIGKLNWQTALEISLLSRWELRKVDFYSNNTILGAYRFMIGQGGDLQRCFDRQNLFTPLFIALGARRKHVSVYYTLAD